MSNQYPGGIIIANPTAPTATSAGGIWTAAQAQQYTKDGIWPRSPGAPTIGTATAGSSGCASITFSAPSCTGSASISSYTLVSTPGCFSGSGASSPVVVSGLTSGASYTFTAKATNGAGTGPVSGASNSITAKLAGQQAYTTAGTYSWVAPTGVTSVSVVAVGSGGGGSYGNACCYCYGPNGGSGGGGGGLGYKNNYSVTPGNSYTVVVGAGGTANTAGNCSYFVSTAVLKGGKGGIGTSGGFRGTDAPGGTYTGDGGGNGGTGGKGGGSNYTGAGGGAGGYAGTGGAGASATSAGASGSAGSGGGGGGGAKAICAYGLFGAGGGGVGLLGQGCSGAGGTNASACTTGGRGGSGGANGSNSNAGSAGTNGGAYGGGGGGRPNGYSNPVGTGGVGAVRIIWPGNTRSFPSTCTGNL